MARVEVRRYDLYSLLYAAVSWGIGQGLLRSLGESVTHRQEMASLYMRNLVKEYAPFLTKEQRAKLAKRIDDFRGDYPWAIIPEEWGRMAKWLLEVKNA